MFEQAYLDDCLVELRKLKKQAENAVVQIDDRQFFELIDADANSVALIMKHMAGNMRSRWTNFLTTDGEKPDRNRDAEFDREDLDTRGSVIERWDRGWQLVFGAIQSLKPEDVARTVTVRGEPMTVMQAINRQLAHYAAHVGQIVLLAKHFAGSQWTTLSIPKAPRRN